MTNLEFYKDKILKNINNSYSLSCAVCCVMNNFDIGIENGCSGVMCKPAKAVEWMLAEHKEPIKLTKFEYDLLKCYQETKDDGEFVDHYILIEMQYKGHFQDVDYNLTIEEILDNCEVIDK